jgi:SNF2 family DNA or RNA helicase
MLAMPMSSGKSRVVIDYIQTEDIRTVLILAPKSVIDVWPEQFDKHAEHRTDYLVHQMGYGSVKQRTEDADAFLEAAQKSNQTYIGVINYQAAFREPFRSWALQQRWDLVVLDESHRIKSPGGKQSWFCKRLTERSTARLCLTGTPMPHSPLDIYAQYRFLAPDTFGTRVDAFKLAYCYVGGFSGRQIIGWHNLKDLRRRYKTLAFESSEAELKLLPEQDIVRHCELEPKARQHYGELKKEFITATEQGIVTAGNALVKLLRFQQITSGFFQHQAHPKAPKVIEDISHAKSDLLADILEDFHPDEPLVIFCRFHPEMDRLHTLCQRLKRPTYELSGRINQLKYWQAGLRPILITQVQSGAEGIDLTRARYGICSSLGFSLGDYRQIRRRVNRTTQTRAVTWIHLVCRNTVDQKVYRGFKNQEDVINMVLKEGIE